MKRKPLTPLYMAQKLWGTDKTTFARPRYVPEGTCEWCRKPLQNKRQTSCCSKECSLQFGIATSSVYYANSGSRGGYGNHILRRDNYTCQDCGEWHGCTNEAGIMLPTTDGQLEVHHIVPVQYAGGDEPDNLISLCHDCHKRRHGQPHITATAGKG